MNGKSTVIATSWGIARCTKDAQEVYRFPRTGLRRDEDPPDMVFFVGLDGAGRRAVFRREGERAHLWSHQNDGMSVVPVKGSEIFDAVPCGDELLLLAVKTRGGEDFLELAHAFFKENGTSIDIGAPVELKAGPKVTWPSRLWSPKEEPWPDDTALGRRKSNDNWMGGARLSANRCGIALASSSSGLVACLGTEGRVEWTAVLPADPGQLDIYALPLPDKRILVVYGASYGLNEYVLLEKNNTSPVAHRSELGDQPAWGASNAGLLWSDDTVLVSSRDVTWALGLPKLTARRFADHAAVVDFGSSPDGNRHIVAFASQSKPQPQNWNLAGYETADKKSKVQDVPLPDFRPAPPPQPEGAQARAKGPALLGAVAVESSWHVPVGKVRDIAITVSNRGGPVRDGFYVQVGGVAKKNGLVELASASISMTDETAADLVKDERTSRIDFPGASLHAGFVVEQTKKTSKAPPPPEQPSLQVTITLRGKKQGSGLLTVRVGPLGKEGRRGSALVGRNLTVD